MVSAIRLISFACGLAGLIVSLQRASAGSYTYHELNLPGRSYTTAVGIDDQGHVVGTYDSAGRRHGFVWYRGHYTTVDAVDDYAFAFTAVNRSGLATGYYLLNNSARSAVAFTYDISTGLRTDFSIPNAYDCGGTAIDSLGKVTGNCSALDVGLTGDVAFKLSSHVRKRLPRFAKSSNELITPTSINRRGVVAGTVRPEGDREYGFTFISGQYTLVDPPGSTNTRVSFIADDGTVAGGFLTPSSDDPGFIKTGGAYTYFRYPGASSTSVDFLLKTGQMVGNWLGQANLHGFVWQNGTYVGIDFPGAIETYIRGVNTRADLVGTINLSTGKYASFIAVCHAPPCTQ